MNNKNMKVWIIGGLILLVISMKFSFKKEANINLEYIGDMEDTPFYDTALINYQNHLVSIVRGDIINLLGMNGQQVCVDYNLGIGNSICPAGGICSSIGGQYINDKIYFLIYTDVWGGGGVQFKILKCENIVWNCDLNDYSTCTPYIDGDCMDMSCSQLFTATDPIWGLCSDGNYIYGTDSDNSQLIKYTITGNKIGTIPLGYRMGGCEYQDGIFYVQDFYSRSIHTYDNSFTLLDTYSMDYYPGRDLAKIDNRIYSLIKESPTGRAWGGVFDIVSYDYTYFASEKDLYLFGGDFQAFITNANKWIAE